MAHSIHQVSYRKDLEPRREPYWGAPLGTGRYIGVRKLEDGTCTWIARMRGDDGKQKYKSLGQVTKANDYEPARKAAIAWFSNVEAGVTPDKPPTVKDACEDYVQELKAEDRQKTAHDAELRFKRLVYNHPLAKVRLERLTAKAIKDWRNGLTTGKNTQNRDLKNLFAALNLAVRNKRVQASVAQEWKAVKPHKNVENRRRLYLDLKQRRALIEACEGAVKDLAQAAALTGARVGELADAKRHQFDSRTQTLTLIGKTGTREIPLSPASSAFFKRVSKSKLPNALLFPDHNGQRWQAWAWRDALREAVAKTDLPAGVVMYTLRHSWITQALQAGMSTLDVCRLTGTSLTQIEKHYGHLIADAARERLAGVELL